MKRTNRVAWLGAIALVVIILLSLVGATNNTTSSGSTYSRAPDGYGAWYAFMQKQGANIQRWQKPASKLPMGKEPATLVQIYGSLQPPFIGIEGEWVEKGNRLVILGVRSPATAARFSTQLLSPFGQVKIDTTRRYKQGEQKQISLGDDFGAIVWRKTLDEGEIIYATTSYLAANAYQDNLSNFQFLASLVTQNSHTIFVDEYIHGYKDADVREEEGQGDLLSYFTQTPILPMFMQAAIVLLVLIWAQNRRFGKPVNLEVPVIDNSTAYIQALAGVLQKAESTDFVVEMVGRQEQMQLQKALGLGTTPQEPQVLLDIWTEKTGISAADLDAVLKLPLLKKPISEKDLISWLGKWQTLRKIQPK